MNKHLPVVLLACALSTVNAKNNDRYNPGFDHEDNPWQEQKENLPPFPDLNDPDWQAFTIDNTFEGTPLLLTSSVYRTPDKSIHYILNIRSTNGYDNLSAEGIYCKEQSYKAFAFGDTVNRRWITTQGGQWQKVGSSLYRQNQIRYALYTVLCQGLFPKDREEIKTRLKAVGE